MQFFIPTLLVEVEYDCMTNLNMEIVFTSPNYVCGKRRGAPHARVLACLAGHGVEIPPPLVGALLPFAVFVFGYSAFKSIEIWNLN